MRSIIKYSLAISAVALLSACSGAMDEVKDTASKAVNTSQYTIDSPKVAALLAKFDKQSLVGGDANLVDCTIGGDTATQCLEFVLPVKPVGYELGPWCPRNIADTDENGGKWIKDGEIYDVSGQFIKDLDKLYGSSEWVLYDEDTGDVRYTDTLYGCQQAARPDVAPEFFRYCIECNLEQIEDGLEIEHTWTIPIDPIVADQPTRTNRLGSGVAFSSVLLNGPAPIHEIIKAYTIAAFDDCGGHANPHEGYHIHAVIDAEDCIKTIASSGGHAPEIGIAMDGFVIHHQKNLDGTIPSDLDDCYGHTTANEGYHYHAGYAGSNQILGCLTGKVAPSGMAPGGGGGMGGPEGMGGMGGPDGMGPPPDGMGPPPAHDDGGH